MTAKTNAFLVTSLTLLCLTGLTALLYWPALQGGFIFDDYHSLSLLKYINNDLSADNLLLYFAYSDTGPLKRPISVLSFLLDAQQWPADPYAFKRTNLFIHLFNGVLLYALLRLVLSGQDRKMVFWVAGLAAGFWVLHPFLVSTTMYIVQRMAMLPATFSLLGLLVFVRARMAGGENNRRMMLGLFVSVYVMTTLAVLSKENGILLFLYLGLTEVLVIQNFLKIQPLNTFNRWFFIRLPVICVMVLMVMQMPQFIDGYHQRDFGLYERLLSQSRALTKYIFHLMIPSYMTEGVFGDGFAVSRGLFSPPSTLLSLVFIIAMLGYAWKVRSQKPLVSWALFFFFAAHSIESTFVPLELYFEHRNYLASLLLPLAFVLLLYSGLKNHRIAVFVLIGLLAFTGFQTRMRAELWGNNMSMHLQTMHHFPESVRARVITAAMYENQGDLKEAKRLYAEGLVMHGLLEYELNLAVLACKEQKLKEKQVMQLAENIKNTTVRKNDFQAVANLFSKLLEKDCDNSKSGDWLDHLLKALDHSIQAHGSIGLGMYHFYTGRRGLQQKAYQQALPHFSRSFEVSGEYKVLIRVIVAYLSEGQPELAMTLIDQGLLRHGKEFKFKIDWKKVGEELKYFRRIAEEDMVNKK